MFSIVAKGPECMQQYVLHNTKGCCFGGKLDNDQINRDVGQ